MRLILVRHGQTASNAKKCFNYDDEPLSEEGLRQVEKVAYRLADETIDKLFSSPFPRCIQTAEAIASHHDGLTVQQADALREAGVGVFTGKPMADLRKHLAEEQNKNNIRFGAYTPPEGESLFSVLERVREWFERILVQQHGKTICVVTHGAVCAILTCLATKQEFTQEFFRKTRHPNTAVSIIDVPEKTILTQTCQKHLE